MRLPKGSLLSTVLLGGLVRVWADTETINFDVSRGLDVPLTQTSTWPKLSHESYERVFSAFPAPLDTTIADVCEPVDPASLGTCPHELWLSLGTNEPAWTSYSRFTLRISWPASSPTDFRIDVFSPESLARLINVNSSQARSGVTASATSTDPSFARIRLVNTGVLVPTLRRTNAAPEPVRFMVTLEPLYLGLVPRSVCPTILVIAAVSIFAVIFVVPPIAAYLSSIADRIRAEQMTKSKSKSGEQERKDQ